MSLPAGVAGVLRYDGTNNEAVVPLNADFSGASPNAAGTTDGVTITGLGIYTSASFYFEVVGATGGTLDIYLQYSPDGGTTWVDYIHLAQLAAGASTVIKFAAVSKAGQLTTLTTVGKNHSFGLAAGTVLGGDWGDRMRLVFVAGAGTSLGASQIVKAVFSP